MCKTRSLKYLTQREVNSILPFCCENNGRKYCIDDGVCTSYFQKVSLCVQMLVGHNSVVVDTNVG